MASLLSATILHRHGARGPGDSETSAWESTDEVVTQWKAEEFENLSAVGVQQIKDLGQWFARKYTNDNIGGFKNPRVFFRCSKSARAVESGRDFVSGFNSVLALPVSLLQATADVS